MNHNLYKEIKEARHRDCMNGLNQFFDKHSLDDSRQILWKWLNVCGSGQFYELDCGERDDLLAFYSHLQGLLETLHHVKMILDEEDLNLKRQERNLD